MLRTESLWGVWGSALVVVAIATGCANGPNAQSLEQTLAADPQLNRNPGLFGNGPAQLPADFPTEIPRFPGATLISVESLPGGQGAITRWQSTAASDRVVQFYQQAFLVNDWQIRNRPEDDRQGEFVAQRPNLNVTVAIAPAAANPSTPEAQATPETPTSPTNPASQFSIQYRQTGARSPGTTAQITPGANISNPPIASNANVPASPFQDLGQAPAPLQTYVAELSQLDVFDNTTGRFQPNQPITRREFVRWMMTAQTKIYAHRPALQIRATSIAATPIFQDVPKSDPDFALIQGAAEAGILPSPLSGDATAVVFRPNAPLTREVMLQWKVPLDARRSLATATVAAVKEVWGFQDAARIAPSALKAVLADHQNGEQSNISRAFGYTTLFQPQRPVTRAEAAACLWYFGLQGDGLSATDAQNIQKTPQSSALNPSPSPNPSDPANSLNPNAASAPSPSTLNPAENSSQQFGPPLPSNLQP